MVADSPQGPVEGRLAKFRRKAFVIRSYEDMTDRSASGFDMKKVLGALDLVLLGIGCTVGAGIMVLTGVAAKKYAGPAVVLSYAISGVAAMLTSLCYAEFAADLPVAGGAFNYVGLTFGEFAAWVAACDLILEYTLSAAAVAKGFTSYFASLIGVDLKHLRFQAGLFELDFLAFLMVVLMSLVLARSTKESSLLNSIVVALHIALIVFVFAAGFPHANSENYTPFLPFGIRGCFTGASVVFFSFIGFDTVATAAEEVHNPARDLPIGIVGSLSITTVLYVLMCLVITGMQPYNEIDGDAPFSVAFTKIGMGWAEKIVSSGALAGIVTSLLGSLLGQARIYVTLGRQHLLPAWLARVHEGSGTPRNATYITMCTAGLLALFLDIEVLAELVSIGSLVVFAMVNTGVLFRRYYLRREGDPIKPVAIRVIAIIVSSIGFSLSYTERAPVAVPIVFLVLWAVATATFHMLPVRYVPTVFKVPLQPWLPSLGVLACLHLIGSLGWPAYVRWIVWFTLGTTVYFTYSMHHSQGEGNSKQAGAGGIALATMPSTAEDLSRNSEEPLMRKHHTHGNGMLTKLLDNPQHSHEKTTTDGSHQAFADGAGKDAANGTTKLLHAHKQHGSVPEHLEDQDQVGRRGSSAASLNPKLTAVLSGDSMTHRRHGTPSRGSQPESGSDADHVSVRDTHPRRGRLGQAQSSSPAERPSTPQ